MLPAIPSTGKGKYMSTFPAYDDPAIDQYPPAALQELAENLGIDLTSFVPLDNPEKRESLIGACHLALWRQAESRSIHDATILSRLPQTPAPQ